MFNRATNEDSGSKNWKSKYSQLYEELKRKEREWIEAEELLRRTIRRLTIAANGVHPALDKRLADLRDAMASHLDLDILKEITTSMPGTLMELSKETQHQLTPAKMLIRLSDQMASIDSLRQQASALKSKLNADPDHDELEKIVTDFGNLISINAIANPAQNNNPQIEESQTGNEVNLINVFVSNLDFPEISHTTLKSIQARSAEAGPEIRKQLAIELTELLNRAGAQLEERIIAKETKGYQAAEAILLLIEFLNFPEFLCADVANVRARLEKPLSEEDWPRLLKLLANLIERARNQIQQQKNELENFLAELTGHLESIELNVSGITTVHEKSKASDDAIHKNVNESVDGIHHSITNLDDIEKLRQSVFSQLDNLREHVKTHQQQQKEAHAESEALVTELTKKLELMENETTVLREQVNEHHLQASIDPLTKAHNRLAFDERIALEFARWKRENKPLSLVIWDADHFKLVNDTFGHLAGDDVLRYITGVLQNHLRESDFVARYGGEEFIMVLPGADSNAALTVADAIRSAIEFGNFNVDGKPVPITLSAGIAEFATGDEPDDVFARADNALYEAKRLGRNRCVIATQDSGKASWQI